MTEKSFADLLSWQEAQELRAACLDDQAFSHALSLVNRVLRGHGINLGSNSATGDGTAHGLPPAPDQLHPIHPHHPSTPYTPHKLTAPVAPVSLMVVNDNPVAMEMFRSFLAPLGASLSFYDGLSSFEELGRRRIEGAPFPQVIILDTGMAEMATEDLFREIRQLKEGKHLPMLVLTDDSDWRRKSRVHPGDDLLDCVTKPITQDKLQRGVVSVFSRAVEHGYYPEHLGDEAFSA